MSTFKVVKDSSHSYLKVLLEKDQKGVIPQATEHFVEGTCSIYTTRNPWERREHHLTETLKFNACVTGELVCSCHRPVHTEGPGLAEGLICPEQG